MLKSSSVLEQVHLGSKITPTKAVGSAGSGGTTSPEAGGQDGEKVIDSLHPLALLPRSLVLIFLCSCWERMAVSNALSGRFKRIESESSSILEVDSRRRASLVIPQVMSPAEMSRMLSEAVIDIGDFEAEAVERVTSGEGRVNSAGEGRVNSAGEGRVPSSDGRDRDREGKGMVPSLLSRIFSKKK
jgi:hypothetical protein